MLLSLPLVKSITHKAQSKMAQRRVAVVTGANKGIGFHVVKLLCTRFQGDVFLCSRDQKRGETAVSELNSIGLKPLFFKLDISNHDDLVSLKNRLEKEYGGVDLLVNNAAISALPDKTKTEEENINAQVKTVKTNYFDTAAVCDTLLPIVKGGGRVVNVSSAVGMLKFLKNESIAAQLNSPQLTRERLDEIAHKYVEDLKNGCDEINGWPLKGFAYTSSKILLSALTFLQQRQMSEKKVAVFAVHPGYVKTDLTRNRGFLTPEQGAGSIVFASLDAQPGDEYKGKIIFPPDTARDWLSDDVFGTGMSVDHIINLMKTHS